MKNVFYFILGVCLIDLTSATTVSVMKVEPAKPKSVICFYEYQELHVVERIREYVSRGYIVKSCNGTSSAGRWIVIMEKY
jgi:hypothetical protein